MSRTDKTKPFWVKLMHGDLAWEEIHHHADGICDMPDIRSATAWDWKPDCHRSFTYTGIQTCCCSMCRGNWLCDERKKERYEGKRQCREWEKEYGHYGWDGCLGNGQYCEQCLDDYAYYEDGPWRSK